MLATFGIDQVRPVLVIRRCSSSSKSMVSTHAPPSAHLDEHVPHQHGALHTRGCSACHKGVTPRRRGMGLSLVQPSRGNVSWGIGITPCVAAKSKRRPSQRPDAEYESRPDLSQGQARRNTTWTRSRSRSWSPRSTPCRSARSSRKAIAMLHRCSTTPSSLLSTLPWSCHRRAWHRRTRRWYSGASASTGRPCRCRGPPARGGVRETPRAAKSGRGQLGGSSGTIWGFARLGTQRSTGEAPGSGAKSSGRDIAPSLRTDPLASSVGAELQTSPPPIPRAQPLRVTHCVFEYAQDAWKAKML